MCEPLPNQTDKAMDIAYKECESIELSIARPRPSFLSTHSSLLAPRSSRAFTLVELLVVITIIGILAALITVAAVGALKNAHETRNQDRDQSDRQGVSTSTKQIRAAYPPNCQVDDEDTGTANASPRSMKAGVFNDLKRHMQAGISAQPGIGRLVACLGWTDCGSETCR